MSIWSNGLSSSSSQFYILVVGYVPFKKHLHFEIDIIMYAQSGFMQHHGVI